MQIGTSWLDGICSECEDKSPLLPFASVSPALPKPPGTPIVTETTATSVTITWDSGNPDPVSYYIIQYRAKGPDSKYETVDSITTTRYSIGGLYPNTEYEIRVSAFNSIGQGPSSPRVEARTGEQAPASPPRNVQAHIISQNTVMVRWEEPEEPNGQVRVGQGFYFFAFHICICLDEVCSDHV